MMTLTETGNEDQVKISGHCCHLILVDSQLPRYFGRHYLMSSESSANNDLNLFQLWFNHRDTLSPNGKYIHLMGNCLLVFKNRDEFNRNCVQVKNGTTLSSSKRRAVTHSLIPLTGIVYKRKITLTHKYKLFFLFSNGKLICDLALW